MQVMRSTDFGSKGMYKPTTTIGGKTNLGKWLENNESLGDMWKGSAYGSINFTEAANLKLSGNTFDSKHMT